MTESELIADTNRLLREYMELHRQQLEESEKRQQEFDAETKKHDLNRDVAMLQALKEKGFSEEEIMASGDDWETRARIVREKAQERVKFAQKKVEEIQIASLAELQAQTELLRAIKEKVGA